MPKILFSMALASTTLAAVPASAQVWRLQPAFRTQIQSDISQLNNRITRAAQRRTISQREATGLRRQATYVQQLYNSYARNGLTRNEVTALEYRINRVHQILRIERRDWDGRRG